VRMLLLARAAASSCPGLQVADVPEVNRSGIGASNTEGDWDRNVAQCSRNGQTPFAMRAPLTGMSHSRPKWPTVPAFGAGRLRRHRLSAPLLGSHVGERLREGPLVTRKVLGGVLAFAKGHVGRLHEDSGSGLACMFAVRLGVLHPDQHRVSHLPRAWRCAISSHVSDYDCTIAELKLRSMVFTDPDALPESERIGEPNHCRSNIRVDKNRDNGCIRY
jgi:hypothetical protein